MKNNAIFARKCEINYQMWIKKCKSGKVSYSLLSYKWRIFQLVNFITICCTTTHSIPYCALCLFAFKSGPPEQTRSVLPMVIIGAPRANQDLSVCYGEERRYELPAGSPKIFDLLGCFSTMTKSSVCATSLPNARTPRKVFNPNLSSVCFQIGAPRVNPERPSNGMEGAASA